MFLFFSTTRQTWLKCTIGRRKECMVWDARCFVTSNRRTWCALLDYVPSKISSKCLIWLLIVFSQPLSPSIFCACRLKLSFPHLIWDNYCVLASFTRHNEPLQRWVKSANISINELSEPRIFSSLFQSHASPHAFLTDSAFETLLGKQFFLFMLFFVETRQLQKNKKTKTKTFNLFIRVPSSHPPVCMQHDDFSPNIQARFSIHKLSTARQLSLFHGLATWVETLVGRSHTQHFITSLKTGKWCI